MDVPKDIAELTKLFERLGAPDAELWARSQIEDGIPQLQRFLFLRQAWRNVGDENDVNWIERQIAEFERYPTEPYAGVGSALKRCLAKGVSSQDLAEIARGARAEMLFQISYMLDDPGF